MYASMLIARAASTNSDGTLCVIEGAVVAEYVLSLPDRHLELPIAISLAWEPTDPDPCAGFLSIIGPDGEEAVSRTRVSVQRGIGGMAGHVFVINSAFSLGRHEVVLVLNGIERARNAFDVVEQ